MIILNRDHFEDLDNYYSFKNCFKRALAEARLAKLYTEDGKGSIAQSFADEKMTKIIDILEEVEFED